jgi:hypothetical protein
MTYSEMHLSLPNCFFHLTPNSEAILPIFLVLSVLISRAGLEDGTPLALGEERGRKDQEVFIGVAIPPLGALHGLPCVRLGDFGPHVLGCFHFSRDGDDRGVVTMGSL